MTSMVEPTRKRHPAKLWQNKLFWHDRSDQPETMQAIDLLHDIRFLLLVLCFLTFFGN